MRKRVAKLTFSILNPYVASLVIILLLSFESTADALDALRWSLVLTAIVILPVFVVSIYLVRKGRLDSIFTGVRQQRTRVYALAGVCAAMGYAILFGYRAPLLLQAGFATGFTAAIIFLAINLRWKISMHTACIAALITILVLLYGWIAIVAVVLALVMGWARLELKQHSVAQVIAGGLLAASIVIGGFHLFGVA